ncbi:Hypothetical protein PP7435_CHR1-1609 [Komagataella phaffii CBS 7435]|uniref:Uncharacterized protein n=1 Tax=Komagataella phaffii (strain ATCC 76273 / CBS 7435 / CECT 11047 / NRRL Y-11430 / Wegner 21-1) TaxID=981350 RepID=A0A1G4KP07_KOMPC|nr:Hypothetical protein BQ9382_C1-0068 [Komagataella phaffii CBS 7435]SCV11751.1 Hypothetical protein PP7435_CHR1-1609 [Komagataella phaffii CBS 7435]
MGLEDFWLGFSSNGRILTLGLPQATFDSQSTIRELFVINNRLRLFGNPRISYDTILKHC